MAHEVAVSVMEPPHVMADRAATMMVSRSVRGTVRRVAGRMRRRPMMGGVAVLCGCRRERRQQRGEYQHQAEKAHAVTSKIHVHGKTSVLRVPVTHATTISPKHATSDHRETTIVRHKWRCRCFRDELPGDSSR
jgi:hypothetical protein